MLCDVLQRFNLSAPHFSTPRQALQRGGWHSIISLCIQSLNSTVRASSTTKCDICVTSEGATPPSSLILTHAPDQNPLVGFGCPYSDGSLQVVAGPCWEMALPDIISAILSRRVGIGPLPRSVFPVHLPASPRKTTASPQTSQVRHTGLPLQCNFNRVFYFGAAVIL